MQVNLYHREVIEYFQFIQEWFNGRLPNTDKEFSRITNTTPEDSTYINHLGELTSLKKAISEYRPAHGGGLGLQLQIDNFRLHWEQGDLALVTFDQGLQLSSGNSRIQVASAIYRKNPATPNGIELLHIHYTEQSEAED